MQVRGSAPQEVLEQRAKVARQTLVVLCPTCKAEVFRVSQRQANAQPATTEKLAAMAVKKHAARTKGAPAGGCLETGMIYREEKEAR